MLSIWTAEKFSSLGKSYINISDIDAVRDALQTNVTGLLELFENNYSIAPDILRTFVNTTFNEDFVRNIYVL